MIAAQHSDEVVSGGGISLLEAFREVEERVTTLKTDVRDLYYAVVLSQKDCPRCREPALTMVRDGLAICGSCAKRVDPTLAFQACPDCEYSLIRKICHYWCPRCRQPVRSLYCIETRVFDAAYFREKMKESRDRQRHDKAAVHESVRVERSESVVMPAPMQLDQLPQLEIDLNAVIAAVVPEALRDAVATHFDLEAYRRHLLDLVQGCIVQFDGISPLIDNARLDRIFRFVTAIFLEHERQLDIEQVEGGRLRLIGK